jgi:hypothetical protein
MREPEASRQKFKVNPAIEPRKAIIVAARIDLCNSESARMALYKHLFPNAWIKVDVGHFNTSSLLV